LDQATVRKGKDSTADSKLTYRGDFFSSFSRSTTFDATSTAGLLVTDHGSWHVVNGVVTRHVADYTATSGSSGDAHLVDTGVYTVAYPNPTTVTTVDTNTGHGEWSLTVAGHLDTTAARPDTFHRVDTYTFDTTLTSVTGSYTVPHHQVTTNSYVINNPSATVNPLATQYQTTYVNMGPTVALYSPHAHYPLGGVNFYGGYGVGYMGFGAFYVNTGITNAYPGVAIPHTYDTTNSNGAILHAPYALVSPYGSQSYTFTPVAKTINATEPAAAKPAPTASPLDTETLPEVPHTPFPLPEGPKPQIQSDVLEAILDGAAEALDAIESPVPAAGCGEANDVSLSNIKNLRADANAEVRKVTSEIGQSLQDSGWQPVNADDDGEFGKILHLRASSELRLRDNWAVDIYVEKSTKKVLSIGHAPSGLGMRSSLYNQIDAAMLLEGWRPKVGEVWDATKALVVDLKAANMTEKNAIAIASKIGHLSADGDVALIQPAVRWSANEGFVPIKRLQLVGKILGVFALGKVAWALVTSGNHDDQFQEVANAAENVLAQNESRDLVQARLAGVQLVEKAHAYLAHFIPEPDILTLLARAKLQDALLR
jgi:hypothetical protein